MPLFLLSLYVVMASNQDVISDDKGGNLSNLSKWQIALLLGVGVGVDAAYYLYRRSQPSKSSSQSAEVKPIVTDESANDETNITNMVILIRGYFITENSLVVLTFDENDVTTVVGVSRSKAFESVDKCCCSQVAKFIFDCRTSDIDDHSFFSTSLIASCSTYKLLHDINLISCSLCVHSLRYFTNCNSFFCLTSRQWMTVL